MNKKELINLSKGSLEFRDDENVIRLEDLHSFFESNVCIEKGDNRHPCAEVWHEYIEDTTKDIQYFHDDTWFSTSISIDKYRIKMDVPTYEWQWMEMQIDGTWQLTSYETTEESTAVGEGLGRTPEYRIEQTKRERK